ncbi:LysR substrate-binding domain-containing protein, partial [Rhizobiaceae sp. 2RAB30]
LMDYAGGSTEKLLQEDIVDIAMAGEPDLSDWASSALLLHAPYVVIASAGHPRIAEARIGPREQLPLDLFCEIHHVVRSTNGSVICEVDPALAKVGRKRHIALILPHTLGVAIAAARSLHLAIVPSQFAELVAPNLGLEIYEAPVPLQAADIRMIWHSRCDGDAGHQWLRQ